MHDSVEDDDDDDDEEEDEEDDDDDMDMDEDEEEEEEGAVENKEVNFQPLLSRSPFFSQWLISLFLTADRP